jgi:hypothetical protein
MDDQQHQHLTELRQSCKRRLHILELQQASFGLYTPPHIIIEIETLRKEIMSIDAQFATDQQRVLSGSSKASISILFLSADPTDTTRLRLGEEFREIQEKLQLAKLREQFTLHQRTSVRPMDISQALLDVQPQIVHFSGHGDASGALCFENHAGEAQLVAPDALADLFRHFSHHVRCVVLNACYSEMQANAIASHVDTVVGMTKAIGDKAAIAFALGFYQALGAGRVVEDAYAIGCALINLNGIPEHLTPVLIRKH